MTPPSDRPPMPPLRRLAASVLLLWTLSAGAGTAAPDPSQAYLKGKDAYGAGDFEAAREAWQPAAEQGDGWAQYGMGLLNDPSAGDAPEPNPARALDWYRKAAGQDVPAAQNNLALLYAQGAPGLPREPKRAVTLWQKAAENGHAAAAYNLASAYLSGFGTERDEERAIQELERAAELGLASAAETLARRHAQDVPEDAALPEDALRWYRRAAELGSDPAQRVLDRQDAIASESSETPDRQAMTDRSRSARDGQPPSEAPAAQETGSPDASAALAPPDQAPAPSTQIYSVQVGSLTTIDAAKQEWQRLQRLFPEALGDADLMVEIKNGQHRLKAGFFAEAEPAEALCQQLRAKNQQCLVIAR